MGSQSASTDVQVQAGAVVQFRRPGDDYLNEGAKRQSSLGRDENTAARNLHAPAPPLNEDSAHPHQLVSNVCRDGVPAIRGTLAPRPYLC